MNALLDAALEYAARGWPIFQCRPGSKQPYADTNGVLDATTDPDKIREMWKQHPRANIGLDVGGAGFMILDLDPGHSIEALEANIGKLPPTKLIQKSPRGGLHLFFALSDGEICSPSASKLADKVDVRSHNSYVLLAPSHTVEGKGSVDGDYSWVSEGKPAHRSDEMLRLANTFREKHADRDKWLILPDMPEHIEKAVKWLRESARISVEGQGGDNNAYATAAMMHSFGLTPETAFDLMWQHWNPRCSPPWGEDEIDHLEAKVRHAYEYRTSPPGNCTDAYRAAVAAEKFKPVRDPIASGNAYRSGRFRFVDREGLAHIPPASWLIRGTIPAGAHAILFGAPGTFKTFVAIDVGLSIACGFPMDGLWTDQVVTPGPVLMCVGEGRSEIEKRVRAWEARHWGGHKVKNFILGDPVPSASAAAFDAGEWDGFVDGALAMSPSGYALTIIDTVGRSMQGMNENQQQDASQFTRLSEFLRRDDNLGGAILALQHEGIDAPGRERGSSVFAADADTRLGLTREGKDYTVKLMMHKQKDAPEWLHPKSIKLETVDLGKSAEGEPVNSLAVMPLGQLQAQAREAKVATEEKSKQLKKEIQAELAEKLLVKTLLKHRPKTWTGQRLAEMLAPELGLSASSIATHYLKPIKESGEQSHASRCYDRVAGNWRYAD